MIRYLSFIIFALFAAIGCAAPEPLRASIVLRADPSAGTVELAHSAPARGPQAFGPLPIVSDGVPGSGPANTVELVTTSIAFDGDCGSEYAAPPGETRAFCAGVVMRHFYNGAVDDAQVVVDKVTDTSGREISGHGPLNSDPGLSGWLYTAPGQSVGVLGAAPSNAGSRDWVFANPDNASTWIYLTAKGDPQ